VALKGIPSHNACRREGTKGAPPEADNDALHGGVRSYRRHLLSITETVIWGAAFGARSTRSSPEAPASSRASDPTDGTSAISYWRSEPVDAARTQSRSPRSGARPSTTHRRIPPAGHRVPSEEHRPIVRAAAFGAGFGRAVSWRRTTTPLPLAGDRHHSETSARGNLLRKLLGTRSALTLLRRR
jgi:hypothetical protein